MKSLLCVVAVTASVACAGPAAASSSAPSVSDRDRQWLSMMHQANLADVRVGELAARKGRSPRVRSAGAMLVTDHRHSDDQVTRTAADLGVSLPAAATPEDAAAAARLEKESGAQFDHDFVSTMLTGHQKVISATQGEIAHGSAPQVTRLARNTLAALRKHLQHLATLRESASTD